MSKSVTLSAQMRRLTVCISTLLAFPVGAGMFGPSNVAECMLDRIPGVANDVAAGAIFQACRSEFGSLDDMALGSGRGLFSYKNGTECGADKAARTSSTLAARMIFVACKKLYDPPPEPAFVDPFDDLTPRSGASPLPSTEKRARPAAPTSPIAQPCTPPGCIPIDQIEWDKVQSIPPASGKR